MLMIDWPTRGHNYTEEEINKVAKIMRDEDSSLTQGYYVKQFEQDFEKYISCSNCFTTMSGAHALDLAALVANIQSGDEVIIPAHTYCASALAFAKRGAKIRWADIDPDTLTVSYESIVNLVNSNTKAILVVHIYGLICKDILQICKMSKERNIIVIEDCAQSLGAKLNDQHCGTFGDIGCYSFHSQKNITTLGEGGMIVVKDNDISTKIPGLRLNGHSPFNDKQSYWLPAMVNVKSDIDGIWPFKSTMSEAQAALGSMLLTRLDDLTNARRNRDNIIRSYLSEIGALKFQYTYNIEAHSHHLLPAKCTATSWSRNDLIDLLFKKYKVKCIVQYYPLYRYDLFVKNGLGEAKVPITDEFFDNMISFPFSLQITDDKFTYLCSSIKDAITELGDG